MEKKRGRKSAADVALNIIPMPDKPRAPKLLTDEQQKIWDTVISAHGHDWLSPDQTPILIQYCRHTITAKRISQLIQEEENTKETGFDVNHYMKLLRSQEGESRATMALARSLRITNQSRYPSDSAKVRPEPGGEPIWWNEFKDGPWEDNG